VNESRLPMNLTKSEVQHQTPIADTKPDSAKLLSLLALATGAVAMPQTSNADIIFSDLSANPVNIGPATNHNFVINTLPGSAQIGFHTLFNNNTTRFIIGRQEAGYVRLKTNAQFLAYVDPGVNWSAIAGHTFASAPAAGVKGNGSYGPTGYTDKFLLFEFKDDTQAGNPMRFGWIEVSLANNANTNLFPNLTIIGYAYDTTGALLASGQVPEPSAPALLALGAMALGAKGLRNWRKNRQNGSKA